MTPEATIQQLNQQGVLLWANGDRLAWRAPRGGMSAAQRSRLADQRDELLAVLRAEPLEVDRERAAWAWREAVEERAAIYEFEAGMARDEAERLAAVAYEAWLYRLAIWRMGRWEPVICPAGAEVKAWLAQQHSGDPLVGLQVWRCATGPSFGPFKRG